MLDDTHDVPVDFDHSAWPALTSVRLRQQYSIAQRGLVEGMSSLSVRPSDMMDMG